MAGRAAIAVLCPLGCVGVIASAVVLVVRPRLFPVVFVIMLAMWFLYPRKAARK